MKAEPWPDFLQRARRSSKPPPGALLCLDPGETIGYSLWLDGQLELANQRKIYTMRDIGKLMGSFDDAELEHIVMESYRIYPWQLKQHSFSDVPTLRYIGALQMLASQRRIPITLQAAAVAKEFATDAKLRAWGLWQPNKRHANDSIKHGAHFLLFHA